MQQAIPQVFVEISPELLRLMERRDIDLRSLIRYANVGDVIAVQPAEIPSATTGIGVRGEGWKILTTAGEIAVLVTALLNLQQAVNAELGGHEAQCEVEYVEEIASPNHPRTIRHIRRTMLCEPLSDAQTEMKLEIELGRWLILHFDLSSKDSRP